MNKLWSRMSPQERRLARIVAVLAVLFLLYALALPALGYVRALDERIDSMEQNLLNMARQAAQSYTVGQRYGQLAELHSTTWTEAEIQDGLQRELDRLALREPDSGNAAPLVRITSRPSGHLTPFTGYREYQATFTTAPGDIRAIAEFLRRLQQSSQALRVDRLELRRDPYSKAVAADITVTRVVVDRSAQAAPAPEAAPPSEEPAGNLARNPSFESWDAAANAFPEWEAKDCTVAQVAENNTDGAAALKAVATGQQGYVCQVHTLVAGRRYKVALDLAATGSARLEIVNRATGKPFEGSQALRADGNQYRYQLGEFTVPGAPGSQVELAVPYLALEGEGSTVYADNVVLERVP